MDDMLKDFVVEAMDLAVNVEEHLLRLERDPDNKETLNAVFRSFHTIKGGAGFMGLPALVAACHLTENLFDALRTGAAPVTPIAIEAALQASGFVADQLGDLNNGTPPEGLAQMPADLERILMDAIEGKGNSAPAPVAAPVVQAPVVAAPVAVAAAVAPVVGDDGLDWVGMYNTVVPAASAIAGEPAVAAAAVITAAPAPVVAQATPAAAAPSTAVATTAAPAPGGKGWDGTERRNDTKPVANAPAKDERSSSTRCSKWRANRSRLQTKLPCCSNACSNSSLKARPRR
jgi:two-component system chemotaxis sensor kinase CheA